MPPVFPDRHDHGHDDQHGKTAALQQVCSVRFQATDIWGSGVDSRHRLHLSLWDDHLEAIKNAV